MKSDARVRYTKIRIKEAFFELLEEKDFQKISVTCLCERAEINRATFYKHYLDIYDLLEKIEDEILEQSRQTWASLAPQNSVAGMENIIVGLTKTNYSQIISIFKVDPSFSNKITELMCSNVSNNLVRNLPYTKTEQAMINRIMIYGYGSTIRNWLLSNDEDKLSAHELAVFLYNMTLKITTK